jgi:hypothetical protein
MPPRTRDSVLPRKATSAEVARLAWRLALSTCSFLCRSTAPALACLACLATHPHLLNTPARQWRLVKHRALQLAPASLHNRGGPSAARSLSAPAAQHPRASTYTYHSTTMDAALGRARRGAAAAARPASLAPCAPAASTSLPRPRQRLHAPRLPAAAAQQAQPRALAPQQACSGQARHGGSRSGGVVARAGTLDVMPAWTPDQIAGMVFFVSGGHAGLVLLPVQPAVLASRWPVSVPRSRCRGLAERPAQK